jgi:Ca2+-binding RTX toxin-like protein
VGNKYRITDRGVPTIPVNSGCRASNASGKSKSEICLTKGVQRFDFKLGDKDDVLTLNNVAKPVIIAGEAGDDTITGGRGADSIDGGRGDDSLDGAGGRDTITGGAGDDQLRGGKGNDVLSGGPGNDSIYGGPGNDSIEAGAGDDFIDARDGEADQIDCGSGNDTVLADAIDTVASNCETVTRF